MSNPRSRAALGARAAPWARRGCQRVRWRLQGARSEALAHQCFWTSYPLSETRGFLKALVAADGDRILGFTAFGVGAAEMMSAVQIAMIAGLPYTALRDAVLTHPTLVEGADTAVLLRCVGAQRCRCDTHQERGDAVKREERQDNDVEEMGGQEHTSASRARHDGVLGLRGTCYNVLVIMVPCER